MPEPNYLKAMKHRRPHRECVFYGDPTAETCVCQRIGKEVIGASKACVYGKQRPKEEKDAG